MLDWIASALALIVLILNGNKKIICWPIWLLGNVLGFLRCHTLRVVNRTCELRFCRGKHRRLEEVVSE